MTSCHCTKFDLLFCVLSMLIVSCMLIYCSSYMVIQRHKLIFFTKLKQANDSESNENSSCNAYFLGVAGASHMGFPDLAMRYNSSNSLHHELLGLAT